MTLTAFQRRKVVALGRRGRSQEVARTGRLHERRAKSLDLLVQLFSLFGNARLHLADPVVQLSTLQLDVGESFPAAQRRSQASGLRDAVVGGGVTGRDASVLVLGVAGVGRVRPFSLPTAAERLRAHEPVELKGRDFAT